MYKKQMHILPCIVHVLQKIQVLPLRDQPAKAKAPRRRTLQPASQFTTLCGRDGCPPPPKPVAVDYEHTATAAFVSGLMLAAASADQPHARRRREGREGSAHHFAPGELSGRAFGNHQAGKRRCRLPHCPFARATPRWPVQRGDALVCRCGCCVAGAHGDALVRQC